MRNSVYTYKYSIYTHIYTYTHIQIQFKISVTFLIKTRYPIHGVGTNDHVYGWKDINQILSSYLSYIKDLNDL